MSEGKEKTVTTKKEVALAGVSLSRRELLSKGLAVAGWGTLFTLSAGGAVETLRFFTPSVVFRPPTTFEVGVPADFASEGSPDEYGVILVDDAWKAEHRFFIVRDANRIYAMYARCPHLGCTINWFPGLNIFKCPCHGSQFYSDGVNFAGPAPRALDRLRISMSPEGSIVVDTSVSYTREQFEEKKVYIQV